MEGEKSDTDMAYMIMNDSADGPYFHQEWQDMNALRIPGSFENIGTSNMIMTAGGGYYGHLDGAAAGGRSMHQAEECWRKCINPVEYAKDHKELARAFETFQVGAD